MCIYIYIHWSLYIYSTLTIAYIYMQYAPINILPHYIRSNIMFAMIRNGTLKRRDLPLLIWGIFGLHMWSTPSSAKICPVSLGCIFFFMCMFIYIYIWHITHGQMVHYWAWSIGYRSKLLVFTSCVQKIALPNSWCGWMFTPNGPPKTGTTWFFPPGNDWGRMMKLI